MRPSASPVRVNTVSRDWRSPLPSEKQHAYLVTVRKLEISYTMFSVALDEALGFRRQGRLNHAYQVLSVSPSLCGRFARSMKALLRAMTAHAKHFGTTPNLLPLDPENFHTLRSRRTANLSSLYARILLSRRSQFQHKISILEDLVEDLGSVFARTTDQLSEDLYPEPDKMWDLLDQAHYDLNTCLRECIVTFKSFLMALPDKQLGEFSGALEKEAFAEQKEPLRDKSHLAHRRMALLKGQ